MPSIPWGGVFATAAVAASVHLAWQNAIPSVQQLMVERSEMMAYVRSGRFLNDQGRAVWYRVTGAGDKPYLLLLHGFPTSSIDWLSIEPQLAANFTVISFDFLGFGLSDKPSGHTYLLQEQAGLAERLLKHLGVHSVHILAHDYGASVAQELLARGIERTFPDWANAGRDIHTGRPPVPSWQLTIESVVLLNAGILQEQHRPLFMQRLLAHRFAGPIIARVGMYAATFRQSLNRVFGPRTQLTPEDALPHWVLLSHKHGVLVVPRLLDYMVQRKQYNARWRDALFHSRAPVAVINGPADPVSGAHLFAAYTQLRQVYLEEAQALVQAREGGQAFRTASPAADAGVLAARQLDAAVSLPAHIGHYPQLEAPTETLSALQPSTRVFRRGPCEQDHHEDRTNSVDDCGWRGAVDSIMRSCCTPRVMLWA